MLAHIVRRFTLHSVVLASLALVSAETSGAAELAYVALENAGRVAVVDLASGRVVERIEVGPLPRFVTISADGSVAAVINEGDQTISVVSTAENTVAETLTMADILPRLSPEDIESAVAGQMLFEGLPDADEGVPDAGMPDYSGPGAGLGGWSGGGLMTGGEVALSRDGSVLYLPDQLYGLTAYDRRTGEARTFGSEPGNPLTIENYRGIIRFDPAGDRLLIPSHNSVTLFDAEALAPEAIVESRGFQTRPVFDVTHDGRRVITPPSFNLGTADVAVEMEITDVETFDYRRLEVTGSAPMHQRPSGQPAVPMYQGIWQTADTELSPDDRVLYAVRSYSMLGGTPRLGGGGLGEIGAFDTETGRTLAMADLEAEVFGLQTFHNGSYLALVQPSLNRIDIRDAGSLDLIRSIDVGPTPRGGQNFIVRADVAQSATVPQTQPLPAPPSDRTTAPSGIEF